MAESIKTTVTVAILCMVIAIAGFIVINGFSETNTQYTLYAHKEDGISTFKTFNKTAPIEADEYLTLKSAASGHVSMGNSTTFALEDIHSRLYTFSNLSTWTFTYRGVANVSGKAKFEVTITIVTPAGALVDTLGTNVALGTEFIDDANATYTGTFTPVSEYVVDLDNYLKVEWKVSKSDTTKMQIDLLFECSEQAKVDMTKVSLYGNYKTLPTVERTIISIVWVIIFAVIAIAVLYEGFGKK